QTGLPGPARTLLILLAALLIFVGLQLVPLPPALWTSLPGRERIAEGFEMLGQPLPWLPLSLSPNGTLAALLWLLPAIAALLGIVLLGAYRASILAWTLIGITMVSVMVAAMQVAGGSANPLYFYLVTNYGMGVGFFANSNHQATLLLCALPFAAALYANRGKSRSAKGGSGLMVALIGVALIVAVGLAINGSLAGAGLGVAVALASILLLRYRSTKPPAWTPIAAAAALIGAVALAFLGPTSGGALIKELKFSSTSRQTMVETTLEAATGHLPFGSGVGTFASVYRTYENPAEVTSTWVNHAHSDFAEIFLETGIPGILLMIAFFAWWGRRAYTVWAEAERPDAFARAGVIASAAVIAHSLVDYPLRTAAISTLFAICLALMAQPRPAHRARAESGEKEEVRHLSA
ncbi:MAG TPA: O-antigen ligase family protein, partial [Lautropia sp.]|nr:O-antigen ligase family protein [Lautropia sp.]